MTRATDILAQRRKERIVPVLKTARLTLRAPRLRDAKAIAHFAGDRRVAENTTSVRHPYTIDDAEEFVAAANRQAADITFVISLDDDVIGACGIELRESAAEVGYWLGALYWGRGYATETARAAIDYAFGDLGQAALQAGARVSNPASRRVLEKCGFQWTGVRLCRIRAIKSAAPVDRFRLDRDLWASLKAWGRVREVA